MATDNVQRLNSYLKTKGIKLDYEEVRQQVEGYYLQYQYNIPSTNVNPPVIVNALISTTNPKNMIGIDNRINFNPVRILDLYSW